ncbi:MAG: hypothetical protein FJW99_06015 [Actinobacteria bacterium]|nr:hypothetical protein [Actinomycetota bacterium]
MDPDDTGTDYGYDDQPTGVSGPLPPAEGPNPRDRGSSSRGRGGSGTGSGGGRGRRGGSGGGSGRRSSGSSGRSSGSGRGGGAMQSTGARIAFAVGGAIVLIVVLVLVVRGCQRSQLEDSYGSYMGDVTTIVTASGKESDALQEVLLNKNGAKAPELQVQVREIADQAEGLVGQANALSPPDSLSAPNQSLVTALQYRVTGLKALADALPSVVESQNRAYASATLASAMQRFLASDVLYQDSFVGPSKRALADADITGVQVPDRQFFLSGVRADQASPTGAGQLIPALQRTGTADGTGTSTTGGLHGTGIASVQALPQGVQLQAGTDTEIQASDKLEWQVTVENAGDFAESNVIVRVTFASDASPKDAQTVEKEITAIQSGEQQSVTLPGPKSPTFGEPSTLKVEVVPVPGEEKTDNNRAEYPVKIVF